jgi:D-alanyl-D-alanine carboxypeptidase/D-alanyl-D-alanine-endopeptidase (penicillin-binding protein 4)
MRFRSSLLLALALTLAACHQAPRLAAAPTPPLLSSTIDELRRDIDATLAAPDLARAYWGILVTSLRTGDTLYAMTAGRLLMPGSAIKIATLAAAAERLGWNYAYTRVLGSGAINAGVLTATSGRRIETRASWMPHICSTSGLTPQGKRRPGNRWKDCRRRQRVRR